MSTRRARMILPKQLVEDIDQMVGRRRRRGFIVQAAENELMHAAQWVSRLRKESDQRLDRIRRR